MISAKEARELTNGALRDSQLKKVEKKIKIAIEKGFGCIDMDYLSDVTIEELKKLGYEVKHYSTYYEEYWTICW